MYDNFSERFFLQQLTMGCTCDNAIPYVPVVTNGASKVAIEQYNTLWFSRDTHRNIMRYVRNRDRCNCYSQCFNRDKHDLIRNKTTTSNNICFNSEKNTKNDLCQQPRKCYECYQCKCEIYSMIENVSICYSCLVNLLPN